MKKLFISYRRQDSGPSARYIAAECTHRFGEKSVFIDTDSIRMGDKWGEKIIDALHEASIIIVIIGPNWLHAHDEHGRRRIDNESDWVRNEVLYGLSSRAKVIPLLVQGAKGMGHSSLPDALVELANIQNYEVSDAHWKRDMRSLFKVFEGHGLASIKKNAKYIYPAALDQTLCLTELEISQCLRELPEWEIKESTEESGEGVIDVKELCRNYMFSSFDDCMHFMMVASRAISKMEHHPRWENLWVNLNVSLSTWDIGSTLSYKDVRLAKYLDELFIAYKKASIY